LEKTQERKSRIQFETNQKRRKKKWPLEILKREGLRERKKGVPLKFVEKRGGKEGERADWCGGLGKCCGKGGPAGGELAEKSRTGWGESQGRFTFKLKRVDRKKYTTKWRKKGPCRRGGAVH